ncbi:hypothetical protein [Bacillus sp. FJAT-45350]|uniref:hypothetical protein n=1 Tax=Bacillus sp. FJAT-45350 TaxID=2011014 RepID=UPI000BB7EB8C|nr:hypothetical protein [Bacillus sp. FJAT-45350]
MSCQHYYNLCKESVGAEVEIRDHHGKMYVGTIERVDPEFVYLRPIGPTSTDHGHGMYFFAAAALTAVALVSIAAFRFRRRPFHHHHHGPYYY